MSYDCTDDVIEHMRKVAYWLQRFYDALISRSKYHDNSKLQNPQEKAMFDIWTPKLKEFKFGSDEYKAALVEMGKGLKLHYEANRHHPEHYENGINGMTLIDVVEMVADWMAAAQAKGNFVDLDYLSNRFGLSEQLVKIIANQLREEDVWNEVDSVPVPYFCPPDMRNGNVEGFETIKK